MVGFKKSLNQSPVYYVYTFVLITHTVKNKIMTKHIRPAIFILLTIFTSTLFAQENTAPGGSAETAAPAAKKSCHDYCKNMMVAPKKGFHHSLEWGGIYGGPRNQVTYRMFGHTFNQDMRDRDAIRMVAGYQFNPYLYVGGGVGAEFQYQAYNNKVVTDYPPNSGTAYPAFTTTAYTGSLVVVPIFAEIKGYLLNKPISPFLQMRMGYAPAIYSGEGKHTVENASYNNISVGVRIYSHLSITAGYLFMYQPSAVSGYDQTINNTPIIDKSSPYQHRLSVGIAIGM